MSTATQKAFGAFVIGVLFFWTPTALHAESQSLTVTPPLFQLSVEPGDIWQSSVKVANSNEYPLSVYASVVNFVAEGEEGKGSFMPVANDPSAEGATLAEWIEVPEGPHIIPEGQTADISFFVDVPETAAPGGHFAAIVIETKPPTHGDQSFAINTSQAVVSLFFVRIEGDVIEKADIRQFNVSDRFVEKPRAEFTLRVENKGNVHIQPKGDIVITNMWGTERGVIPVNNKTHYGNVLPETIRNFQFAWEGEPSLTDIGRYKAVATLAYGIDGVQSMTSTTYFWVVPVKATLLTVGSIALFVWLVTLMVRAYIRRMLTLAGVDVDAERGGERSKKGAAREESSDIKLASYKTVALPIQSGVRDFSTRMSRTEEFIDIIRTIFEFMWQYKLFFVSIAVLIVGFVATVLYVSDASEEGRPYEVTEIKPGDADVTVD